MGIVGSHLKVYLPHLALPTCFGISWLPADLRWHVIMTKVKIREWEWFLALCLHPICQTKSYGPVTELGGGTRKLPGKGCGDRRCKELAPWTSYLFHLHSPRILPYVNLILLFLQPAFQEEPTVPVGVSQMLIILAISPAMPYPQDYLLPPNSHVDGNLHDPCITLYENNTCANLLSPELFN